MGLGLLNYIAVMEVMKLCCDHSLSITNPFHPFHQFSFSLVFCDRIFFSTLGFFVFNDKNVCSVFQRFFFKKHNFITLSPLQF